jgi:hypothetical protein
VGARIRCETYPVVTRSAITKPSTIETTAKIHVKYLDDISGANSLQLTRQEDRAKANVKDEVVEADNHSREGSMNENRRPDAINDRSLWSFFISEPARVHTSGAYLSE